MAVSDLFFRVYQHLLPRSRAWQMTVAGQLRFLFQGLTGLPDDVRTFFAARFADVDPQKTTQLATWERQFGLQDTNLTEQERRDRLDAAWSAVGGQSPRYLQDTIHAAGFTNVFIHEAFVDQPEVPYVPPVIRNPLLYIGDGADFVTCAATPAQDPLIQAGEVEMEAGNTSNPPGFLLVNKIVSSALDYVAAAGDSIMECGELEAQCGNFRAILSIPKFYPVPTDPAEWPYVLYYGGETFPDPASVPASRRDEFETLVLHISPGQQWLGMLVNYS